jgi:hypothetical protein
MAKINVRRLRWSRRVVIDAKDLAGAFRGIGMEDAAKRVESIIAQLENAERR